MRVEIMGLLFILLLFLMTSPNYLMIKASGGGTTTIVGSDTNCSTSADCNNMYVNVEGDTMTGPLTIFTTQADSFNVINGGGTEIFDVNTETTSGPISTRNIRPFTNVGSDVGSETPLKRYLTGYFQNLGSGTLPTDFAFITDLNLGNQTTFNGKIKLDGNMNGDFNIFCSDANCYIGRTGAGPNKNIIFNGLNFTCNGSTWEGCLSIPSNSFAFKVQGSGETGIDFNGVGRFIGMLNNGALTHLFGVSGNSNGLQWMAYNTSLTKAWAGTPTRRPGTLMDYNGGGNGTWPALMIDENGSGNYVSVGSHLIYNDLNADKNVFVKGTLFGERVVVDSGAGQSCHTEATNWNAAMTDINWVCIAVIDHATGSATTCSSTTSLRDCMLRSGTR